AENLFGPSIFDLAQQANSHLFDFLNSQSSFASCFPNIILTDFVSTNAAVLALAINSCSAEQLVIKTEDKKISAKSMKSIKQQKCLKNNKKSILLYLIAFHLLSSTLLLALFLLYMCKVTN